MPDGANQPPTVAIKHPGNPVDEAAEAPLPIDLTGLLDAVDVPIVALDRHSSIVCFNQAAAHVLGLAPGDVGQSSRVIAALQALPNLESWCTEAMISEAPTRHDLRIGDRLFVVRVAPHTTSDGQIRGAVATLTNVTAFRASLDQAVYEREYTKAILNTVADPLVVLGADLLVKTANRAFYSTFGISRDEIQGLSLDKLGKGAFDLPVLKEQLRGITADRAFQPWEVDYDLPEIGPRTVTLQACPIALPGYADCLALLSFHDITERKKVEQTLQTFNTALEQSVADRTRDLTQTLKRLHESEQYFRLLVEGMKNYAICILDIEGIVTDWNPGAAKLQGYHADEILGKHFSVFFTEEDRLNRHPEEILEAVMRDGKCQSETWSVRKDGERFWADVGIDAIYDADGRIIGFVRITRDLTENRAIEEQLRQAQKMEAVGQLTGGIAHDFNNLLGTILPALELARPHIQAPVALKYLDGAVLAAERGAQLTHRLLSFARKEEMVVCAFDVNVIVAELNETLLPRTLGPTVQLEMRLSPDTVFALTDPSQLEAALLNLAINARDAMHFGGTLTISTAHADSREIRHADLPDGDYIVIEVRDTGTGMAEETRKRVFEPFFTTKTHGKGSGLGLSMVYGFARQSGGVVTIESALGAGTTARLYLPQAATPIALGEALGDRPVDAGPPSRILVVDDDDGVRAVTVAMLREFGHETVEATCGNAALALLEQDKRFDAMLVDLMMPDIHGAVFAVQARKILPRTPVLFVTGFAGDHWLGGSWQNYILKKPFRRAQLAERLRGTIGQPIADEPVLE